MKNAEYRMEINVLDTLETTVKISKKVYEQKMASLKRQAAASVEYENEFQVEERETVDEYPQYYRNTYRVTLGTTDIELVAVICKPGYRFIK